MKIKLMGFEEEMDFNKGELSLINIQENKLYRSIIRTFNEGFFDSQNDIVILDDERERVCAKRICYINDILFDEIDNKKILTKLTKDVNRDYLSDLDELERINNEYKKLIENLVSYLNLLDLDYDYNKEIDFSSLLKFMNPSFSLNEKDDVIKKIEYYCTVYTKLFSNDIFVYRGLLEILSREDVEQLIELTQRLDICIIIVDNTLVSNVVIKNQLIIDSEYSELITTVK